jgi:hypothetical protein
VSRDQKSKAAHSKRHHSSTSQGGKRRSHCPEPGRLPVVQLPFTDGARKEQYTTRTIKLLKSVQEWPESGRVKRPQRAPVEACVTLGVWMSRELVHGTSREIERNGV